MFGRRRKAKDRSPGDEGAQSDRLQGEIAPDEVETEPLCKGLALWRSLAGERCFPARKQFTPRALGPLLRHTILVKALDRGRDFQIRVMGDAILAVQTDPIQGLTTTEIEKMLPGYGKVLHRLYRRVYVRKAPVALRGLLKREADGRTFHRENLVLPLGDSDAEVDHLLGFVVYLNPEP